MMAQRLISRRVLKWKWQRYRKHYAMHFAIMFLGLQIPSLVGLRRIENSTEFAIYFIIGLITAIAFVILLLASSHHNFMAHERTVTASDIVGNASRLVGIPGLIILALALPPAAVFAIPAEGKSWSGTTIVIQIAIWWMLWAAIYVFSWNPTGRVTRSSRGSARRN